MEKYSVWLPLVAEIYVEVEAEDKQDAIDKALDTDIDITVQGGEVNDYSLMTKVVEGNFYHGSINNAEAELITDDEDEENEEE